MANRSGTPVRHGRNRTRRKTPLLLKLALALVLMICAVATVYVSYHPPKQQAELAGLPVDDVEQITEELGEKKTQPKEDDKTEEEEQYQGPYPDMVSDSYETEKVAPETDKNKVCYLTFDDGPSENTVKILDTLKEYNAKATFFIVGTEISGHEDVIKRMADEGHTVAIHCNQHEYGKLYASVDDYLKDFNEVYQKLYEITGQYPKCFRFPGGSNNVIAERHDTTQAIIDEMTARGFDYYDWNAYTGDAESGSSASRVYSKAVSEVSGSARSEVILLAHDAAAKTDTADQLPKILSALQDEVEFLPITTSTQPIQFVKPTKTLEREAEAEQEAQQQTQESANTPEETDEN
ncbi:MAG: polysaccharide deacetylase family protein [Butyricicoccaceae bacterium]